MKILRLHTVWSKSNKMKMDIFFEDYEQRNVKLPLFFSS